jgi:hypothetical protein
MLPRITERIFRGGHLLYYCHGKTLGKPFQLPRITGSVALTAKNHTSEEQICQSFKPAGFILPAPKIVLQKDIWFSCVLII